MQPTPCIQLPPGEIGLDLESLRLVCPRAEAAMNRSMQRYGQMTPVLVGSAPDGYQMVDGFKRLRSACKMNCQRLDARVVPGGRRSWKTAMIQFNGRARAIADLEQALVVRSLYRQDGLNQTQIALLLDRHKSWVSRRLSLVENLNEQVVEHIRLGLINITIGRQLAMLPRGNQIDALNTVLKYRLTSRETGQLIGLVMRAARWEAEEILHFPEPILQARHPDAPRGSKADVFIRRLFKMQHWLQIVPSNLTDQQRLLMTPVVGAIGRAVEKLQKDTGRGADHPGPQ